MSWLEDRIRTAALFSLGSTLPFLGLAVLALAAALFLVAFRGPLAPLGWAAGAFLGGNALHGFGLAFLSFPRPPGRRLRPGEAPCLEERLAEATRDWKGPVRPELILAPDAWSVELTGVPVAGVFGWSRFHWYIGIYPLLALTLREFDALVAWEAIFWSDYQGWLNLQAKRLAAFWYRLHLHLEVQVRDHPQPWSWRRWTVLALRPYARFAVLQFQPFLAREFVRTDRAVAEKHGTATLVRALCRLAVLQPLVARRGFADWDAHLDCGRPLPADLYQHLAQILAKGPEEAGDGMLALALDGLQREAPPLLRLRLEYLDAQAQVPLPVAAQAFQPLLEGTGLLDEIHARWQERMRDTAAEAERRTREDRRRYEILAQRLAGRYPDHPNSLEYLELAFDHAPWDEFDVLLGMFREARPDSAEGSFLAIRRALQRGRDYGAVLEARDLLKRNPLLAPACHEVLAHHLRRRGDHANADREWDRALRAEALVERIRRERMDASVLDPLEPHGCGPSDLQRIQRMCLDDPRVQEAWLLRKKVAFHADRTVLLLVVRCRGVGWDPFGRKRRTCERELQAACPFPAEATGFIQVLGATSLWRVAGKLRRLGGQIFRR